MSSSRRFGLVVAMGGVLAGLALLPFARAQLKQVAPVPLPVQVDPTPGIDPNEFTDAITLPKNADAKKLIGAADDLIKEEAWGQAAQALQSLLDSKEDFFVDVRHKDAGGKETVRWVSVRAEANRLIGSMPPEGLQFYELQFGPAARADLAKARETGDAGLLATVAQKYLHTEAGAQATRMLAHYHLDNGRYLMAALCYERLLSRQGADKVPTPTLLKAVIAFHRAGDKANAEAAWNYLAKKAGPNGVAVGDQNIRLDDLRQVVDKAAKAAEPASIYDVLLFRGNASRTAQGHGGPPFLEKRWSASTTDAYYADENAKKAAQKHIDDELLAPAVRHFEERGQPMLPAFFPVAVGGKLIYRSYDGIYARTIKDGKDSQDHDYKAGELDWVQPMNGSLFAMVVRPDDWNDLKVKMPWMQPYLDSGPQGIFFENSVIGALSTDGSYVYAVDDLAVPPSPQMMAQFGFNQQAVHLGRFQSNYQQNKLVAIDLRTGKLAWDSEKSVKSADNRDFRDTFFLGPPLPLGGKLYALTERNGELRLVCFNVLRGETDLKLEINWDQTLATARDRLPNDLSRRINVAHLAFGDGILVCPTNAGAALGVDLLTHSLVWAHSYREGQNDTRPKTMNQFGMPMGSVPLASDWKPSAPAIQDDRVVLTAPDASAVHCLNLRDGRLLWKHPRGPEDLYMAGVFNGKVVIVGKGYIRALRLGDGQQAWRTETGLPSGQGVASENVYYLPLKAANDNKEPAVFGINLQNGTVESRTRSRKKEVPGNLIFYEGEVLSQTVNAVASYPQLKVKLSQIDELLAKNPADPTGLTERGELRLDQGNHQGALDDLHAALLAKPNAETQAKARTKLYETLTEMLQRDFTKSEQYLTEYKDLCRADDAEEQRRRQANYLCLLAKGREGQGRFAEAFDSYLEFGALSGNKELISVVDEPSTRSRPDVWARGRIGELLKKATKSAPAQRQPLEDRINQRWTAVKDTTDLNGLRQFVDLFGSLSAAGREARLHLAELLLEQGKEEGLRDAEMHLLQLRSQRDEPVMAGRAVEALARLMLRLRLMPDAAAYYRELGRDFADTVIRDGKTGADFYNELLTDKRFLPYLEDARQVWHGKFKPEQLAGGVPQQQAIAFEAEGELLPFFQTHRAILENGTFQLKFIERGTNREHWRTDKLWNNPNFGPTNYLFNNGLNIRNNYRVIGHVVVFNLGYMVYGLDPIAKKQLWQVNLLGPGTNLGASQNLRFMADPDGVLQIIYPDGWMQRLGQTGPVEPAYVAILTRSGLLALDPATGQTLWSKTDVLPRTQVFGDAEHVYLVEMGGDGNVPTNSRAVRAKDGVTVEVPPFHELYQRKQRILGRNLLVSDTDAQGQLVLRLYDVQSGQDIWKKPFPASSQVLRSDDPSLAGAVDPTGRVSVTDLRTRKEVLRTRVEKEHAAKMQEARLLTDADQFYLILNQAVGARPQPFGGGPWTNVTGGMRWLAVNGPVYAFDRQGCWWHCGSSLGEPNWWETVTNQMLVLDQFKDSPLVLFTARYNKLINLGPNRFTSTNVVENVAFDKRTGRLVEKKELPNAGNMFHTLTIDPRAGMVELVAHNFRLRFTLENPTGKVTQADPSAGEGPPVPLQPVAGVGVAVPPAPPVAVPIRRFVVPVPAVPIGPQKPQVD